jgi:hypothetical protein
MDTTDPEIEFDEEGLCSHCINYDMTVRKTLLDEEEREKELQALLLHIK